LASRVKILTHDSHGIVGCGLYSLPGRNRVLDTVVIAEECDALLILGF
jgi:hypothetical protein